MHSQASKRHRTALEYEDPIVGKTGLSSESLTPVTGKEVLGRKLSVIKTTKKEALWVKGAVKEFDEPTIRHKVCYSLQLFLLLAASVSKTWHS